LPSRQSPCSRPTRENAALTPEAVCAASGVRQFAGPAAGAGSERPVDHRTAVPTHYSVSCARIPRCAGSQVSGGNRPPNLRARTGALAALRCADYRSAMRPRAAAKVEGTPRGARLPRREDVTMFLEWKSARMRRWLLVWEASPRAGRLVWLQPPPGRLCLSSRRNFDDGFMVDGKIHGTRDEAVLMCCMMQ
jgi:hypothetical protein